MSLRKSPTRTPALLAANRRNAQKSTGPRTARGKAVSRFNSLREGGHSREYRNFFMALFDAPPGRVDVTAQALLQGQQVNHKLLLEAADLLVQAEIEVIEDLRRERAE